ncbi:MAG: hypothetical protein LBQ24_03975 [Candidatus Peribacteria bacterium]|nr:hypothetical protein [Candidatus Peribacteria bacterium]
MINLLKLENLKNSIKRFPISFVLILVITILFFILNNFTSYNSKYEEMLIKSIFASILAFFLSL